MLLQQGVRVDEPSRSWGQLNPGADRAGKSGAGSGSSYPVPRARDGSSGSCCWQPSSASAADSSRAGASGSWTRRRRPAGGTASPLPASSPSVPVDPPPTRGAVRRRHRLPAAPARADARPAADGELGAGLGRALPEGLAGLHGAGRGRGPTEGPQRLRRAPVPPGRRAGRRWLQPPGKDGERPSGPPVPMVAARLAAVRSEAYAPEVTVLQPERGLVEVHLP